MALSANPFICVVALLIFWCTVIQSQAQSIPALPVADMHYHFSMRAYNKHGIELLRGHHPGKKWIDFRNRKGLKIRHNGYVIRPRATNSHMKNFTQATIPHTTEGNVKLIFNAITPFEYTLNDQYFDRLFSHFFKTHAKMRWLKVIGNWKKLTHFQSYNSELRMLSLQESRDDSLWRYWTGKEAKVDSTQIYVVNVAEGSHILQHKIFNPALQFSPKEKQHRARYLHAIKDQVADSIQQLPAKQEKEAEASLRQLQREMKKSSSDPSEVDSINAMTTPMLDSVTRSLEDQIRGELSENVRHLKSSDPPVFMVTVGHLSYNGMVGHAPALDGNRIARILLRKFFRTRVSNDRIWQKNWDDKFHSPPLPNDFGLLVIDSLLSRKNGHRIYVDLKHSSFTTREWFYDNVAVRDTVPPICSHCAANGLSKIHYSVSTDEYAYADSKTVKNFYPLSINLYDEEIQRICALNGIIGITLEERVLGGYMNNAVHTDPDVSVEKRRKENVMRIKKLYREGRLESHINSIKAEAIVPPYRARLTDKEAFKILCTDYICAEPFLQNLFYMIDKSGKGKDAWRHFCLGSDFDGFVDPIDIAPTASQYPYFRNRLKQLIPVFLELRDADSNSWKKYFRDEKEIDEKLNLLFYGSLSEFVAKYFNR